MIDTKKIAKLFEDAGLKKYSLTDLTDRKIVFFPGSERYSSICFQTTGATLEEDCLILSFQRLSLEEKPNDHSYAKKIYWDVNDRTWRMAIYDKNDNHAVSITGKIEVK